VDDLEQAIAAFLDAWNANPTPFVWTASVEKILEKGDRCRRRLDQIEPGCVAPMRPGKTTAQSGKLFVGHYTSPIAPSNAPRVPRPRDVPILQTPYRHPSDDSGEPTSVRIPTGFRPPAEGCRACKSTLGDPSRGSFQPQCGCGSLHLWRRFFIAGLGVLVPRANPRRSLPERRRRRPSWVLCTQ